MLSLDLLCSPKTSRVIPRTNLFRTFAFLVLLTILYQTWSFNNITCIHVSELNPPAKNLGSLYQRAQLAFFLASDLSAKLSIGPYTTFSECKQPERGCVLHEDELMLPRCNRGDCVCHAQKIAPYLKKIYKCSTLQLTVDEFSTSEFSGCTHEAVRRYLPPLRGSYNVLVFSGSGVKDMSEKEAKYIQRQLCRLSSNDILVISGTTTKVPICENRTILATGLGDEAIVRLIEGAENVGAKGGENVHMGVAGMNGGRLIITSSGMSEFDWAPVDAFTVLGERGAVYHFDGVGIMRHAIRGGEPEKMLTKWSFRMEGDEQVHPETFLWDVPKKFWSNHGLSTIRK